MTSETLSGRKETEVSLAQRWVDGLSSTQGMVGYLGLVDRVLTSLGK